MACSCSPAPFAVARPPSLTRDIHGRLCVSRAAERHELSKRIDPGGTMSKDRSLLNCDLARSKTLSSSHSLEDADVKYKDCKCDVKGECKKEAPCKRVRFSDDALLFSEEPSAAPDRSDQAPPRLGTYGLTQVASCECPCRAAFSPRPPATLVTGDIYRTCGLPKRFQYPAWFSGYNSGPRHPLYRTSASDVGRYPPTVHTVPTIYRPIDQSWSKIYAAAGPWRNHSLCNTGSIWDYNY